jgi:hypothetical protein
MNNHQINKILKRVMGEHFRGVFPRDGLPPILGPFPYGLVVNTDKLGAPGRHWQAIWMHSSTTAEFFDSFGDEPKGEIKTYLANLNLIKNNKKIQANYEISCGPFVIYYLLQKMRRKTLEKVVKYLSNRKFVDTYVKLFVNSLLKL